MPTAGSGQGVKATAKKPFPKTFEEFLEWFSTEEDCKKYLEWIRWPDGFVCPGCGAMSAWHTDRGLWHCQECQRQSSPTAGTVCEDSREPLRLWFHVMWVLSSLCFLMAIFISRMISPVTVSKMSSDN